MTDLAKILIFSGGLLIVIGLGVLLFSKYPQYFSWLGHLPGDIHIRRENFHFYFPLTTCLLLSTLLTLLFFLLSRR